MNLINQYTRASHNVFSPLHYLPMLFLNVNTLILSQWLFLDMPGDIKISINQIDISVYIDVRLHHKLANI